MAVSKHRRRHDTSDGRRALERLCEENAPTTGSLSIAAYAAWDDRKENYRRSWCTLLSYSSFDLILSGTHSIPFHLYYIPLSHHHPFSLPNLTHICELYPPLVFLQYRLDPPLLCILIPIYPQPYSHPRFPWSSLVPNLTFILALYYNISPAFVFWPYPPIY